MARLAEQREQHFADLSRSGRWRHYYTHAEFLDEMRKPLHVRNQWAALAGLPVKSLPSDQNGAHGAAPVSRPLADTPRRRPALTLVTNTFAPA